MGTEDYDIEVGEDGSLSRTYMPGSEPENPLSDLPAVPRVCSGYEIGVVEASGDKAILVQFNRRNLTSNGGGDDEPVVLVFDVMTMGGFITRMLSTMKREF